MGSTRTIHRAITHAFLFLFLLALAYPLAAQEAPVLAILPFEGIEVSRDDAGTVYTFLEGSFSATGVYTVIPAEQRDQILGSPDAAACTSEDCAVKVGKKLSADQVVLGTVALADGRYIVNARIIATANSRTLAADSISAAGAGELAGVCDTLTVSLIRRAMPGSLEEEVAEPSERATEGEGSKGDGTDGAVVQPGGGMDEAAPESVELTRADLWPLVNICGGMFMMELGNVMGSMGSELRRTMSDSYADYTETTWNFDELWKTYNSAYIGYVVTTTASYVSWSAGVASIPTYLFVFPDRAFRLSRLGTTVFAAGAALSVAGNVLDLLAGAQRYKNDFLYEDYLSAGTGFDELYDRYRTGHVVYSVERLTGYAFWLFGGAGMISAFFLPGPKEERVSGFWEKTSLIVGTALVGLGSVTRTVALNHRQNQIESGGDEKAYDRYILNSVLSYSLWAAGGVGMVLPFVTDIGRGKTEAQVTPVRPEKLRFERLQLIPLPQGMVLRISY
jgi:hypothetical protein